MQMWPFNERINKLVPQSQNVACAGTDTVSIRCRTKCYLSAPLAKCTLWVLWLICQIELGYGQDQVWLDSDGQQGIALYIPERHQHLSPVIILNEVPLHAVPNELRPSRLNFRVPTGTTSESLPAMTVSLVAQHSPMRGQYRSINARSSNPAKSPLSPQAFSLSSIRRQLPLSSAKSPMSSVQSSAASVVPQSKQTEYNRNTNLLAAGENAVKDTAAKLQIDRVSKLAQQTFHSVASENVDKVDTIGDVSQRLMQQQTDDSKKTRRISKRKLEEYEDLLGSVAEHQNNNRTTINESVTISTRFDKQEPTNDAIAWNGQRNDTLSSSASNGAAKGTDELNYANESTKQSDNAVHKDKPDWTAADAKHNQTSNKETKHKELPTRTSIATAAPTDLKQLHAVHTIQKGIDFKQASLKAQPTETITIDSGTIFGEHQTDEDNEDSHGDQSDDKEHGHGEANSDDPSEEEASEEDPSIGQYSSSLSMPGVVSADSTKQNVSSLVSQDYANRDRGFGFIRAWAWDRAENYRVKGKRHGTRDNGLQRQLGHSNWREI